MLQKIVKAHNREFVTKTLRREDVTSANYLQVLAKKWKTTEAGTSDLMQLTKADHYPDALAKLIWKFDKGDLVTLARRSDPTLTDRNAWEKPSVVGSFGPRVWKIASRWTKNSMSMHIIPLYKLEGLENLLVYQSELSPALFAESPGTARTKDRQRRLRERQKKRRLLLLRQKKRAKSRRSVKDAAAAAAASEATAAAGV